MKRLTKDERVGATVLALVALLICGGSLLLRRTSTSGNEKSEKAVETIILAADSVKKAEKETKEKKIREDSLKKHRRDSLKREKPLKTGKKRGGKRKSKQKEPTRDILSEPIPQ